MWSNESRTCKQVVGGPALMGDVPSAESRGRRAAQPSWDASRWKRHLNWVLKKKQEFERRER